MRTLEYTVRWKGLYADRYPTRDTALKQAHLALATVESWTPQQRKLNPKIVVSDPAGQVIVTLNVLDELARMRDKSQPEGAEAGDTLREGTA